MHATALKVPRMTEEVMRKYQRLAHFAIGRHTVYIQARWDPAKRWTPMRYKVTNAELEAFFNSWPIEWREPVSIVEVST